MAALLGDLPTVESVELVPLSTRGDEVLDRSLQKIGGKGLFIKELEVAMEAGDADIAVHSMKDVPAEMPDGFCIAAVLERANWADAFVSEQAASVAELAEGARIGSSSLRRQAQLKLLRSDLVIEPLRGNVNTRLAKLGNGDYDAIILAAAGLERLGLERHIRRQFTVDEMLPAAAQGVIGIECLETNNDLRELLGHLAHRATGLTTLAERAIARTLGASCQSPVAAHAVIANDQVSVTALVAMPDGSSVVRETITGPVAQAEALGVQLAEQLLAMGANEILAVTEGANE